MSTERIKFTADLLRLGSKARLFIDICELDLETGYSKIIPAPTLEKHGLKTTNGGDWCRSDGPLGKYFNIYREKEKGRIFSIQLQGYKKNDFSRKISGEVRAEILKKKCVVLSTGGKYIEVDHKDGRKDDYHMPENQKISDFQAMHRSANLAKRQHCKSCKNTGARFDATSLGYSVPQWIGPVNYQGSCLGCYWHDPYVFNQKVSDCFHKDR